MGNPLTDGFRRLASSQLATMAPEIRAQIQPLFDQAMDWMACLYDVQEDQKALLELAYGRLPERVDKTRDNPFGERDPRFMPRSLVSPPTYYQCKNAAGDVAESGDHIVIEVEKDLGRFSGSGYLANLSDTNEFDYVLVSSNGERTARVTLPTRANEPITFFVKQILIYPTGGNPARYKARVD